MGSPMDESGMQLCRTHRGLCRGGGSALQWIILRHLLIEEEGPHARALLLERVDLKR